MSGASGSIGTALTSFIDARVRETLRSAGVDPGAVKGATADASTFGTHLETAEQTYQRAQMLDLAAGHGPGDAMMDALSQAADARAERRHNKGNDLFGF